ncbi:hypothetical protein [Paenibacillus donghaensis]|uniref:Uncharacterized protein n=1 Tax=Paenibacillus donghaensis TaxID=414771 RepID=A0A2Z2KQU9_9BACL|nr:hypothetical protein [Paenibacillus donghaensis]ASA21288.1 hypothetical protein B9T62_11120 [Paenibacillus donghaensis]
MVEKSVLQKLASEITNDDELFSDYLLSLANSGEIYEKQYGHILTAALQKLPSWEDIIDIISPVTIELLAYTAEYHQAIFQELLHDIKKAHDNLAGCREEIEIVINRHTDSELMVVEKLHDIKRLADEGLPVKELQDELKSRGYLRTVFIRTNNYTPRDEIEGAEA